MSHDAFDDFDDLADIFGNSLSDSKGSNGDAEDIDFDDVFKDPESDNSNNKSKKSPVHVFVYMKAKNGDAQAQFETGKAYIDVDRDEAILWLNKAAEQGHIQAKEMLCQLNEDSSGLHNMLDQFPDAQYLYAMEIIDEKPTEAIKLLELSADKDYDKSLFTLGCLYISGQYIKEDKNKGMNLLFRAAENGLPEAQSVYGDILLEDNNPDGRIWIIKAAENGYPDAQFKVALWYADGIGVEENSELADELLKKAANGGNSEAQFILGCYYIDEDSEEYSVEKGRYWLEQSSKNGNKEASDMLSQL